MAGFVGYVTKFLYSLPAPLHARILWAGHRAMRLAWRWRRPLARGACVIVHDGHRVLLQRCSYRADLILPGGGIDPGETALAAAVRELREEMAVEVEPHGLEPLGVWRHGEHGRRIETMLFAWRPSPLPSPRPDGREILWAGYVALADLGPGRVSAMLTRILTAVLETGRLPESGPIDTATP